MSDFTVIHEDTPPQGNPLYAEIERLKKERDALADHLELVCKQYENVRAAEGYPFPSLVIKNARAALAQVRK